MSNGPNELRDACRAFIAERGWHDAILLGTAMIVEGVLASDRLAVKMSYEIARPHVDALFKLVLVNLPKVDTATATPWTPPRNATGAGDA